jgi:hypothetical protein
MLRIDPKMLARPKEIEADLILRRKHAEAEVWPGEIEGIDLTLTFLRDKRAHGGVPEKVCAARSVADRARRCGKRRHTHN